MANMSASILRNLVSSVYNVKATEVILSGELPETFVLCSNYSHGCMFTKEYGYNVSAFHPERGFFPIKGTGVGCSQNANGTWNDESIISFQDCAEQGKDAIFFLVYEHDYYSAVGSETRRDITWTLYKAPNFAQYWAKIEEADVQRWEEWLSA